VEEMSRETVCFWGSGDAGMHVGGELGDDDHVLRRRSWAEIRGATATLAVATSTMAAVWCCLLGPSSSASSAYVALAFLAFVFVTEKMRTKKKSVKIGQWEHG
jgi:hypothetical protein